MGALARFAVLAVLLTTASPVLPAWAADTGEQSQETPAVHVEKLDPTADTRPFEARGFQVHDGAGGRRSEVPLPRERDAAFASAGLLPDVTTWDAVDRDVLYLRARHLDLKTLQKRYPKLNPDSLGKLREIAGGKR